VCEALLRAPGSTRRIQCGFFARAVDAIVDGMVDRDVVGIGVAQLLVLAMWNTSWVSSKERRE
jgi:hypothetical protein